MKTLYELFNELHSSPAPVPSEVRRQPVCLLLGGGMAAGKSTVREIIGNDSFWSKVHLFRALNLDQGVCASFRSAGQIRQRGNLVIRV